MIFPTARSPRWALARIPPDPKAGENPVAVGFSAGFKPSVKKERGENDDWEVSAGRVRFP